jgi:hypothetical protein
MNESRSNFALRAARIASPFALLFALAGCTTSTQDNFTNPPPGPPSTCAQVTALPGCTAGSLSYSCTRDRPDDGDTNLVCDDGAPGPGEDSGAATLFCCAPYGQWATECTPATVDGCGAESFGFACTGGTSPDRADTSLICSGALAGDGGASDYCCVSFDQSSGVCRCASYEPESATCGVTPTACGGAAIGVTCAPSHTPGEVNPLFECTGPDAGAEGTYCCETP